MESLILDQWLEDKWSADSGQSQPATAISDLWSDYTYSTEYDPLAFEDLQSLSDPVSTYNILITPSPSPSPLPSPISDFSSPEEKDKHSWSIPTTFKSSTIDPTDLWSTHGGGNSPAMTIPDLASSSESTESNSPPSFDHNTDTNKPTKRGVKRRSDDSQAKSPKSPKSSRHNSHNLIEKRYRNNLNSKIMSLRKSIPSLCPTNDTRSDEDAMDSDSWESKKKPLKCNKGVILDKAITYIAELRKQKENQAKEIARLQSIIDGGMSSYLYAYGLLQQGH